MASRRLFAVLTVGLVAVGCRQAQSTAKPVSPPPLTVQTAVAGKPEARRTLSLYGTLKTDEDRIGVVTSPIEGKVKRLFVKEGQEVGARQPVLELESRLFAEAELAYRKALTDVSHQQALVERDRDLLKQGALSGDELRQDQTALTKARADLSAAETQLQIYHGTPADLRRLQAGGPVRGVVTVYAPIAGHVLERPVRLGEAVSSERPLMTIVDHRRLWVLARIPETEIARVREAGTAVVRTKAVPDRTYTGHVIHVHDEVDTKSRTLELKLWIDNVDRVLRPEMFATIQLPVQGETGGAVIPRKALQASATGDVVIRRDAGGYSLRPVKVLETIGDATLRVSGLRPGDIVVTDDAEALKAQLTPQEGEDE